MALPPRRIPESVAQLDVEAVAAALIRNDANVRNTARALGVPPGDLRKLVLLDQCLADAALEAVELRLDDAEANLYEALHCDDPRRRDVVSMFLLRNTQRASKRGYAVAASAVSLEVSCNDSGSARKFVFRWEGDDLDETVMERDGISVPVPRYDSGDDCVEGEVADPPVLIEHAPEPEAVLIEREPEPEPQPPLPVWPGPGLPPPLVANLYAPYSPPMIAGVQREEPAPRRPTVLRRRRRV